MTPVVAFTSYAWAQFLRSLKILLETGQGEPFGSRLHLPRERLRVRKGTR